MNIVDVLTLLISIIALLSSFYQSWKTIESQYFNELFKDKLLIDIPLARNDITINSSGEMVGSDKLFDIFDVLPRDCLYYKYIDPEFYRQLNDICVKIPIKISDIVDHKTSENDTKVKLKELDDICIEFYKLMDSKQGGFFGRFRKRSRVKFNFGNNIFKGK